MKARIVFSGLAVIALVCFALFQSLATAPPGPQGASKAMIERGKYLVTVAGCDDCHTPKVMTPKGPMPDTTRTLSGHPASEPALEVPQGVLAPGKWMALTNSHLTAWAGPWGVSYTRNLTPDVATGLGSWTPEIFIKALRTGKDMGEGRDILPPMPWQNFAQMTDQDLRAIFAYLHSLKPIENAVPDPISPAGEKIPTMKKPK